MGRLRSDLSSGVEGEEDGAVLLPGGTLGDYGDPGIAGAVGGVSLFLGKPYTQKAAGSQNGRE